MNRETFLRHMTRLRKLGWTSKFNRNKEIRMRSPEGGRHTYCPVTALWFDRTGAVLPVRIPGKGRLGLGLSKPLGRRIMGAADGVEEDSYYYNKFRAFKYPTLRRNLIGRLHPEGTQS